MPGLVRTIANERDGLLAYLAQQRDALRYAVNGITDEQARVKPSVSALSLGGLIKHVTLTERTWMVSTVAGGPVPTFDWSTIFQLQESETLAGWLETYAEVAAETEAIVNGMNIEDLIPVPREAPWFPKDVEAWTLRWVLLHLIEETARHAGHADILREALDGGTAYQLMAEAEGWADQLAKWMEFAK